MSDTKQRILQSATRLIQSRSYAGFSFQDVADEVGIRKASIYAHYRSKEELAEHVLLEARRAFESAMAPFAEARADVQLENYLALFRRVFSGGERVCPGGSFAAVWSSTPPRLQAAVQDFTRFHLDLVAAILTRGQEDGCIRQGGPPPGRQALLLLSTLEGAMQVGRITGKSRVLDGAIEHLRSQLLP